MSIKRIAIISPAGPVPDGHIESAAQALRHWGYEPALGRHCKENMRAYGVIAHSAPLPDRLDDLLWAIGDPTVDAVLCARGGYGAIQLLDWVDPSLVAAAAKPIIGFSDITALHALWHRAGVPSIHGPMAKHLTECGIDHPDSVLLHRLLEGERPDIVTDGHRLNRPGQATGILTGGNLALLYALLATPYNLVLPGHILVIEDIAEQVYQVQRMLYALRLSGRLQQLAALVVGQFTNYRDNAQGDAMYQMISDMASACDIPVAFGFPVGHVEHNVPLVMGAQVSLTVGTDSTVLSYV